MWQVGEWMILRAWRNRFLTRSLHRTQNGCCYPSCEQMCLIYCWLNIDPFQFLHSFHQNMLSCIGDLGLDRGIKSIAQGQRVRVGDGNIFCNIWVIIFFKHSVEHLKCTFLRFLYLSIIIEYAQDVSEVTMCHDGHPSKLDRLETISKTTIGKNCFSFEKREWLFKYCFVQQLHIIAFFMAIRIM